MKTTIVEGPKVKKVVFPCLMRNRRNLIVLFSSWGRGHVVCDSGVPPYSFGYGTCKPWDMEGFIAFTGKVILEND